MASKPSALTRIQLGLRPGGVSGLAAFSSKAYAPEGEANRKYGAHFASKLTDVDGEVGEIRHWIDTALACQYISSETSKDLIKQVEDIGRWLAV